MNENTLYFIDYKSYFKLVNIDYSKLISNKPKTYINNMLLNHFTTLEGRMNAIKSISNSNYNIPIYINSHLLFFKVQTNPDIWVNLFHIHNISNKTLIFSNGNTLRVNRSNKSLVKSFNSATKLYAIIKGRE